MKLKKTITLLCLAALCAGLCGCAGKTEFPDDPETPHREMLEKTYSEILENYRDNPFVPERSGEMPFHFMPDREAIPAEHFAYNENGNAVYLGSQYDVMYGVDVSDHNGVVDWQAAYESGVRFAMIRIGYRGYTKGAVYADSCFEENVKAAREAGIKIGTYFFSQAISVKEAVEEANYTLELLNGLKLDFPVGYDWERIVGDRARTDNVSFRTATDCAKAFYEILSGAGYDCSLYCIGPSEKCMFYLNELPDYQYWFYLGDDLPAAAYSKFMWQYTTKGTCPGISGECDMDILLTEKPFLKVK